MPVLQLGSKGADVGLYQGFLCDRGYSVTIDNDFGSKTVAATKQFQADHGLQPDGIVGPITLAAVQNPDNHKPSGHSSAHPTLIRTTSADGTEWFGFLGVSYCTDGANVDADGSPWAYGPHGIGMDDIANINSHDDLAHGPDGALYVQSHHDPAPGFYVSKTSLFNPLKGSTDAAKWVDALSVPYLVAPGGAPSVGSPGNVGLLINLKTGVRVCCIVADVGPRNKSGEASVCAVGLVSGLDPSEITYEKAREHGSVINPRNGGIEGKHLRYVIFKGETLGWPSTPEQIAASCERQFNALSPEQQAAVVA